MAVEVFSGIVNDTSLRTFLVSYLIVVDGEKVGGVVIKVSGENGDLELLFVSPSVHSKGIGYAAWCEVERLHPEIKVWETVTPYFEQRNICSTRGSFNGVIPCCAERSPMTTAQGFPITR